MKLILLFNKQNLIFLGGGYILSRKALEKFGKKLVYDHKKCHSRGGAEDAEMGRCLEHEAIFVDCRDELHQKRFFPVSPGEYYGSATYGRWWYRDYTYYDAVQGNLSCCSDTAVAFHYVSCREIYSLEYLVQRVNLFGIASKEDMHPGKFSLEEIIKASDVVSTATQYKQRPFSHNLEESERY